METFAEIIKSPFQLFTAFSENDKDKYFGREDEISVLFQFIQEANTVLVYGESGTGKTSLVQCGLINETKHFNWTSLLIRRAGEINASLHQCLYKNLGSGDNLEFEKSSPATLLKEIFLINFQPVLLIFDQFEELFISGEKSEKALFYSSIKDILRLKIPFKIIFIIKEEFIARLTEFEKVVTGIFKSRLRVELINRINSRKVVIKSCERFDIKLVSDKDDIVEKILDIVADRDKNNLVHLPYLQVFLDTLWKEAYRQKLNPIEFNSDIVTKVGGIGDVLQSYVDEKVNGQNLLSTVDAWKFLKLFVKESGSDRKKILLSDYTAIPASKLSEVVSYFEDSKIVTLYSENTYELAHEILVPVIQKVKINEIRGRLTVPTIHGNPYVGLKSFDVSESDRFYGRSEVINAVLNKIEDNTFIVIAGNSGAGKSSLIKAGLFPRLKEKGFEILDPVIRAGEDPLFWLDVHLQNIDPRKDNRQYILLIDQYEELVTRISDQVVRQKVSDRLFDLIQLQYNPEIKYKLKIIITVRADFEPQFRIMKPLAVFWNAGKYLIPPFSKEEIREVIEEPAYQAGLEFSPPSLVDSISEEVYSSQATGLLPLMSFTLSELFKKYEESGRENNLLTEEDYNGLGGVVGGLQKRAEDLYKFFEIKYPTDSSGYQQMMRNIIFRMIYFSAGELAGQRVAAENLVFTQEKTNGIVKKVVKELLRSHLIIDGIDGKNNRYYEPAHDVLLKSWGQVWDWIGRFGKENLFLLGRLSQSVNDYKVNDFSDLALWNDSPFLDQINNVLKLNDNWLNAKEEEFVTKSKEKRALLIKKEQLLQEERMLLIQEKLAQEEEKGLLIQEKFVEQKKKASRNLIVIMVVSVLCLGALILGIIANDQKNKATKNADLAYLGAKRINRLNDSLKFQIKTTSSALQNAEIQEHLALTSKRAADSATKRANSLNRELFVQFGLAKRNERAAKDSAESAKIARDRATTLAEAAKKDKDSIGKLYSNLVAQQKRNVTQLVSIAKSLEIKDIVKAYRVAQIAYKKDSTNKEAADYFHDLSGKSLYYYTNEYEGDFSTYSGDRKYLLIGSTSKKTLTLLDNYSLKVLSEIPVSKNISSAIFSPDGLSILITYGTEAELRNVLDPAKKVRVAVKWNGISSSSFSPDGQTVLIISNGVICLYNKLGTNKPALTNFFKAGNKVISAVFARDGGSIVCNNDQGDVIFLKATTGEILTRFQSSTGDNDAYISSDGNYFICKVGKSYNLYNGNGEIIKDLSLFDGSQNKLISATFSLDGKQLFLSYNYLSEQQQQQQQQQQQTRGGFVNSYESEEFLMDLQTMKVRKLNSNIGSNAPPFFLTKSSNAIADQHKILVAQSDGLVKLYNLADYNSQQYLLAGHSSLITSMSTDEERQIIMTSSKDNTTRIWRYGIPLNLEKKGLLPILSDADLKDLGIQ